MYYENITIKPEKFLNKINDVIDLIADRYNDFFATQK